MSIVLPGAMLIIIICGLITNKRSEEDIQARFGVMTDMHYYPADLIDPDSRSYKQYLKQDAKLTLESGAVIKAAIADMISHKVEFVILAGDVSNEGERESHIRLAEMLREFGRHNISVYITPGNHDINNGLAYDMRGEELERIESITADEFAEIYFDYGFRQAYSRDKETLSYCAEIKPGLHIITIDANQYKYQGDRPLPDGVIPETTLSWAEQQIREASGSGSRMIGVMHHGLVEHFFEQGKTFAPFLVKDYEEVGKRLAEAGLDFVFTGHLHAQDVSSADYNGIIIYDIETAALTSAPFAWRLLRLKSDELDIETKYLETIDFDYGSDLPFREWAMKRVWQGLLELESYFLKHHNGLNEEQTRLVAPYYARAFLAHFCGDEQPEKEDVEFYEKHKNDPESPFYKVANIFKALWTDQPEGDINLAIPLRRLKRISQ